MKKLFKSIWAYIKIPINAFWSWFKFCGHLEMCRISGKWEPYDCVKGEPVRKNE